MINKKIIFIDWDRTLCWSRFWESLIKNDVRFSQEIDNFFMLEKELVKDWMIGKTTSEEINKVISKRTGLSESVLWNTFVSGCKNMIVDPEIIDLIKKLRKKYFLVLITGNMDCFTRFTVPSLRLKKIFDLIINSADIGYLKDDRNGKAFVDCLSLFNIDSMNNSYLLDDSEKACNMFNQLGGKVLIINDKKDTIKYLKMLLDSDLTTTQ